MKISLISDIVIWLLTLTTWYLIEYFVNEEKGVRLLHFYFLHNVLLKRNEEMNKNEVI